MSKLAAVVVALLLAISLAVAVPVAADAQTVLPACSVSKGKVEKSGAKVRGTGSGSCNVEGTPWGVTVTLYEVRDGKTRKVATGECEAELSTCTARTKWVSKKSGATYYASTFAEAH
jgi:hypothetical protein